MDDLYSKYKNPQGVITWCTVCGRVCTGHRHHKLALAKDPKSELHAASSPFGGEEACIADGGGGLIEKLARYRRMREFALELQDEIGKMNFNDAIDALIEETWNAPLIRKLALPKIAATKTWNIPSEKFLEFRNTNTNAFANVPWAFEGRPDMMPIISAPDDGNVNIITMDDMTRAVQLRHRKENGELVTHDKIGIDTLFGKDGFGSFSVAGTPDFGMCFFRCGAVIYPGELQYILDNYSLGAANANALSEEKYKEYKAKIDMYRERFNEVYKSNAAFKARVDADVAAGKTMAVGGAGAGAGQGGGRRYTTLKRRKQRKATRRFK